VTYYAWCEAVVDALVDLGYNIDYGPLFSYEDTADNSAMETKWLEHKFDDEPFEAFEAGSEPEDFAQDVAERVEE
jgi:hypothetical protein